MAIRPQQTVTSTTPPAVELLAKIVQVKRTDTTAFDAFWLPKNAVLAGGVEARKKNKQTRKKSTVKNKKQNTKTQTQQTSLLSRPLP